MNWKKYLLIGVMVSGLVVALGSLVRGQSEAQRGETAAAAETDLVAETAAEGVPAESKLDHWYASQYGDLSVVNAQSERPRSPKKTLKFDVAEDMTRFVFDESKTFDDGLPAHGSSFITEGYIYEYGTLSAGNGVLPDGSPEFPDKVIGAWVCRGWFVGDAAHATDGVWVVTTQIYNFGEQYGNTTVVSEGYESAVVDYPLARAITGGTGEYAGAKGEAYQTLLGFNEGTEGVNLRFEVELSE